jgi:hypothetical protein
MQTEFANANVNLENNENPRLEMSLRMSSIKLAPKDIKNKIDFFDKPNSNNGYELTELSDIDDSHFAENEIFFVNDFTGEIISEDMFWHKLESKFTEQEEIERL